MRREMSALKKQLDEVQSNTHHGSSPQTVSAPITPITPMQPMPPMQPALEDAIAEEYVEPEKEPENLNLNDLGKQMLEKALERNNGVRYQRPHALSPPEAIWTDGADGAAVDVVLGQL